MNTPNAPWSPAEDETLITAWDAGGTRESVTELLPGRSIWAVNTRLRNLGAGRQKYTFRNGPAAPWTSTDDAILKACMERDLGYEVAAEQLGRTYCAVANRAARNKWRKKDMVVDALYIHPKKIGQWPADMPHFQDNASAVPAEPRYAGGRKRTTTLGGVSEYG